MVETLGKRKVDWQSGWRYHVELLARSGPDAGTLGMRTTIRPDLRIAVFRLFCHPLRCGVKRPSEKSLED